MATIAARFDLASADAVAYMQGKGHHVSWDWHDTEAAAHAQSFTVARGVNADVLHAIRTEVDRAVSDGMTFAQFQNTLRPRLEELGWWGRQEVLDGNSGELTTVQLGSTRRLRTIFQSNVQTAYMAGRYKRYVDNAAQRPYWRYVAILDGRTRPHHRALHGKVWRWDDPIWQVIWPPNGWGCRCRVQALSEQEFQALGVALEDGTGAIGTVDVVVNRDGKTVPVRTVRYKDGIGREQTFRPDPTWDFNPGADYARRIGIASSLAGKVDRLPAQLGSRVAAAVVSDARGAQIIDSAWQGWVAEVLADPVSRKRTGVLGFIQPTQVAALLARGVTVSNTAIKVEDSRIVGRKSLRHVAQGNALEGSDWLIMSQSIRRPQAILLDLKNETVLYVLESDGSQAQRVVVAPSYAVKGETTANLRTAYWSAIEDLKRQVARGDLQLLEGSLQ